MADGVKEQLLLETLADRRNVFAWCLDQRYLAALGHRSRLLLATDDRDVRLGLPRGAFSLLVSQGPRVQLEVLAPLGSPTAIFALFELRDGARPNVPGFGPFKAVACDGGLLTLWRRVEDVTFGTRPAGGQSVGHD